MAEKPIILGLLDSLVGYHIRRASLVFYPDFRKAGFRRGMVGILSVVLANSGINQRTLGKTLGIDTGNLVPLIDALVERGFLKRTVHPSDRRSRVLSVTRAGKAELGKILKRVEQQESDRLASFSKQERATLVSLLKRIHTRGD